MWIRVVDLLRLGVSIYKYSKGGAKWQLEF